MPEIQIHIHYVWKVCFLWLLLFQSPSLSAQTHNWTTLGSQPAVAASLGDRAEYGDIVGDAQNNVIVCGGYFGTIEFGEGADLITFSSEPKPNQQTYDILLLKYDAPGNLLWGLSFGDSDKHSFAHAVDVDAAGNIYMTGIFNETIDFDPGPGVQNLSATSAEGDLFVAKYDPDGNYIWAFAIQGTTNFRQTGYDINVNDAAQVFSLGARLDDPIDIDPLNSSNTISYVTGGEDAAVSGTIGSKKS